MVILIFFIAHWYISLFFQTFFHHRYAAHQMFTMSKPMEKVFIFLSWLTQGSSYLSPYAYGILHRLHHAYADTEKDPHSPKYDKSIWAMMWRTKIIYVDICNERYPLEDKFKANLPHWPAFEKFADGWFSRIAWGTLYTLFYLFCVFYLGESGWLFLLLPIQYLMGPFHGAIINWFAHLWGTAPNKVDDTSKNLLPIDFLMLGESYHNNHHAHPARANFGVKWYQFDPVYPFIKLFHWMRIIKLKPVAVRI
ncbi:MAG TPA: acyl-CoA desaturase [Chitinophagales bacterium]|nr:acyl-CoA desaturase [Chitinophagales bacterium]